MHHSVRFLLRRRGRFYLAAFLTELLVL